MVDLCFSMEKMNGVFTSGARLWRSVWIRVWPIYRFANLLARYEPFSWVNDEHRHYADEILLNGVNYLVCRAERALLFDTGHWYMTSIKYLTDCYRLWSKSDDVKRLSWVKESYSKEIFSLIILYLILTVSFAHNTFCVLISYYLIFYIIFFVIAASCQPCSTCLHIPLSYSHAYLNI